jgi:peptidoglycan hydrolase-like protein with peptidoglycan-binding domain
VSLLGRIGRQPAALFRHRGITAIAGAAVLVLVSGGTFAAVHSKSGHQPGLVSVGDTKPLTHAHSKPKPPPVGPLELVSVSPSNGTHRANGGAPITVTFSSALAPLTPMPRLSPKVAGSWAVSGRTAVFTPSYGYLPDTKITLKIPGGISGMQGLAASAGTLAQPATVRFTTGSFSTIRLQQVLTQLGYLPLTWTPGPATQPSSIPNAGDLNAQVAAAYTPPAGSFAFKSGYPSQLTSQWKAGSDNLLDQGAIRAFESDKGLTMDGIAGPQVWGDLLKAAARGKTNPNGYTYALVTQKYPQSITVWHNGKVIQKSLVNTGIAGRDTQDGTFPVYLRYQFNYMDGTNPDGSKYHDPVWFISYFNGGDAVHYFPRYGYGYYQSLGCVELPYNPAKYVWNYMTYGTLVTVTGPMA